MKIRLSSCHDNVVNLQDHPYALGSESKRANRDEGGLKDISIIHIFNCVFADVQPCVLLSIIVGVAKLGHEHDWVHASVFCERVRNQLEGICKGLANVGVRSVNFT